VIFAVFDVSVKIIHVAVSMSKVMNSRVYTINPGNSTPPKVQD